MNGAVARAEASAMLPSVKPPPCALDKLLASFLAGRCPATVEAYRRDLADFTAFVKAASIDEAAAALLGNGQGEANRIALDYVAHLQARGLAPATTRRRLAALRSLCKVARLIGMIPWRLEVNAPKVRRLKDCRGCGPSGYRKLLAAARSHGDSTKAARDVAMLRVMGDLALRRGETAALDVEDLDLEGERIAVTGKGSGGEKEWLTIPKETADVIRQWLDAKKGLGLPAQGPLFTSLDHRNGTRRISTAGIYDVLKKLGAKAGLKRRTTPHGLRHNAVTMVLDVTGGDLRSAQRFARHADPKTTLAYDDNRKDMAGQAARMIAAMV